MAKNNNLSDFLKDIADKIRSVFGISGNINPQDFVNYIQKGEDVTAEIQYYTDTIAILEEDIGDLELELQGKAAGGGSSTAENCTVSLNLNEFEGKQFAFLYASYINGILTRQWFEPEEAEWTDYTISVAKNTPLTIYYPGNSMWGAIDGDMEPLDDSLYIRQNSICLYHVLITKDTYIELNPDY